VTTPAPRDGASTAVRQAIEADLLAIQRIERESFPQPWPYEAFRRFLGEEGFLVCEQDGAVAGYVVADSMPNYGRPLGHVKDIAVHPEYRGRGLGRLLLRRALGVLDAAGARTVKLEVRAGNDTAIGLYRAFGFEHRRTVPRYYADGEDALVMVREAD
jgi:ribosomal-protein-alanine N-acetyltransferase